MAYRIQKDRKEVLEDLFRVGAIKFGAFKLKLHETQPDAPLSPIYLNLRTSDHPSKPGPLTPEIIHKIGGLYRQLDIVRDDCFTDLPDAGQPFGDLWEGITAGDSPRPRRLKMRKVFRENGARSFSDHIEGDFKPGMTCLVLDDLITQADSKLEAISMLEGAGLTVWEVLVLVDRMQGGAQQLGEDGYNVVSVFTLEEMLEFYAVHGMITETKADEVRAYIAANQVT